MRERVESSDYLANTRLWLQGGVRNSVTSRIIVL